jgi:hypothetical protein
LEDTLIPIGADPNAKDVCRVLRYPLSTYWKDGKPLKQCNIVFDSARQYTWEQLELLFPRKKSLALNQTKGNASSLNDQRPNDYRPAPRRKNTPDDFKSSEAFWAEANNFDVIEGLTRLSGTHWVGGEVYSFKKQSDVIRIIVNGKPSNAWIDKNGKIGSTVGAGPSIPNWLTYFGHDWKTVAKILKEVFYGTHT